MHEQCHRQFLCIVLAKVKCRRSGLHCADAVGCGDEESCGCVCDIHRPAMQLCH